nr:hypothetical protein Itr_chr05CG19720 [Ipomoea trifida]
MGVTFLVSSSALCFAVRETDLSDSNRARRNSILIEGESSMTGVFLMKRFHDFRKMELAEYFANYRIEEFTRIGYASKLQHLSKGLSHSPQESEYMAYQHMALPSLRAYCRMAEI